MTLSGIATLGYGAAAAAFAALAAFQVERRAQREAGRTLLLAAILNAAWACACLLFALHVASAILPTALLEILRNAGWTLLLLRLLSPATAAGRLLPALRMEDSSLPFFILYAALAVVAAWSCFTVFGFDRGAVELAGNVARVGMCVMGILQIEQIFRNASFKARWSIKFACLGIGGIFAYDFYLYVDALLFNRLNAEAWAARGFANVLAAPLIGLSIARNPDWLSGIAISRRALFHSATLLGSGVYLLLVGVAGYYLKFFGGQWGSVLQVFLLFIAATFLAAVLFSGAFRSWLKVSISKHFYDYGYDYREEWLKFTRMLSVEGPDLGERTIQAIAELVESTKGMLFLENGADYAAASSWNMPLARASLPGSASLCEFLKRTHWVVDLNEYGTHPERYAGLEPAPSLGVPDAWLVVPLMQADALFGFVVLSQARSKVGLNWEVRDLLKIAGSQAASYLAKEKSAEALATVRQFDAFNRMSTFVVHDLKNVVSQLALLAANAERHRDNREFQQDMIDTVQHAARKMQVLLQKFSHGMILEHKARAPLGELLQRAVGSKSMLTPKPILDLGDTEAVVLADAARLERVIGHLIQNAIEATSPEGKVCVTLAATADEAIVQVSDTGRGMSQDFVMTRLFKPFHSTKSSGMGIGVYEARDYLLQIGGRLDVESVSGQGTTFRVTLPRLTETFEDEADAA